MTAAARPLHRTSIAVLGLSQPNYLPWPGHLDLIARCHRFYAYDDALYSHGGFRNRNRVLGPGGPMWLTVPVLRRGRGPQRIRDVRINNTVRWRHKHWETLRQVYGRQPYWPLVSDDLLAIYRRDWELLADLALATTRLLLRAFGIRTPVARSGDLGLESFLTHCSASPGTPPDAAAGVAHRLRASRVRPLRATTGDARMAHPARSSATCGEAPEARGGAGRGRSHRSARLAAFASRLDSEVFLEGESGRALVEPAVFARYGVRLCFHRYGPHDTGPWPTAWGAGLSALDLLVRRGPAGLDLLRRGGSVVPCEAHALRNEKSSMNPIGKSI